MARYCRLVNFGENQPFADAEMVFPTISVLEKIPAAAAAPDSVDRPGPPGPWPRAAAAPEASAPRVFRTYFMRGGIPDSIPDAVASDAIDCDDSVFSRSEWRFQPAAVSTLFDRIMAVGRPLGEVVNGRIYRGVLTGLNEAFIIDRPTRDRLVAADPGCAGIIRKLLRGEDLRPWYCQDEGRFLIVMPSGFTRQAMGVHGSQEYPLQGAEDRLKPGLLTAEAAAERAEAFTTSLARRPSQARSNAFSPTAAWDWLSATYPAIAAHLAPFAESAQRRADQGEFWWELRSCAYYSAFNEPKILWPDIAKLPRFSWDTEGAYVNDKGFVISVDANQHWLLSLLQDRLQWFCISQIATPLEHRAGLYRSQCKKQFIERLRIPDLDADSRTRLADLATRATALACERYGLHEQVRHRLRCDFAAGGGLNQALTDWWELDFFSFRQQLEKAFKARIPLADRQDWETTLTGWQQSHHELTARLPVRSRAAHSTRSCSTASDSPATTAALPPTTSTSRQVTRCLSFSVSPGPAKRWPLANSRRSRRPAGE